MVPRRGALKVQRFALVVHLRETTLRFLHPFARYRIPGLSPKRPQMPTVTKRSGGWQAKIRLAGFPPQSAIFDTKARASAWGYAQEAKLREQKSGTVLATLGEVVEKYCTDVCPTHRSGPNEAKRLRALVGTPGLLPVGRQVRDVTALDLSRFRDTRMEQVSVATVRKEMGLLRSVLESARRDWGMLQANPIADVRRPPAPPARKRLMSDDEKTRILEALGWAGHVGTLQHQVAVAMLLALETAMRAGEILGLDWSRVSLERRYVALPQTKNGDQREVPLSTAAVGLLGLMPGNKTGPVFTLTSASLDALFRKARTRCGIAGLHFHDTRANAITRLAGRLDIHDLARVIGHRDLKSLLVYYRKSATDIAHQLG